MNKTQENLLKEAADPSTSKPRLLQLSRLKGKNIRQHIRALIAANPNVDEKLLWNLAQDCDQEVIDNPVFRRLLHDNATWWKRCGTTALIRLLARMGAEATEASRTYLFEQIVDDLIKLDSSQRGEMTWCWEEDIEITWNTSLQADGQGTKECRQKFQVNTGVSPFPSYYTLIVGHRPETPPDLVLLLKALITLSSDFVSGLEIYEDWQLKLEGSDSSSSLSVDSIDPDISDWGFEVDNDHRLKATDPAGFLHCIQLSTDNVEELHKVYSIQDRLLARIFHGFENSRECIDVIRRAFCLDPQQDI